METMGNQQPEYEFDMTENETIAGLAGPMGFVGTMSIVFGLLLAVVLFWGAAHGAAAFSMLAMAIDAAVLIAIGGWLRSAARSFRDIVQTEGSDIANLMAALRRLRSVYTLQAWLIGFAMALFLLGFLLGLSH